MNFENSELKLCPGLISCIYRLTFINVTDIKIKCMHIELIQQSELSSKVLIVVFGAKDIFIGLLKERDHLWSY